VKIPFNRASLVGGELENVQHAFDAHHIAGDGPSTAACHGRLESLLGVRKALLTTSCTHALEMSALLLDIEPGDEIIVPSFTFVSTANAFVLRGGRPVFIDIRPDTLNLDERLLESKLSPRTKAIVPVHYAGVGCEMDVIVPFAERHGLAIVEDNAHGLFGRYRDRPLGSFGVFSTLSFHETKNLTCGEGGALLINDAKYVPRAEIIREKGTNRSQFFRGEVDKYGWIDVGSSYLPSEILAAFLQAQLTSHESIQARRRAAWERYERELGSWAKANGVVTPTIPAHCTQPWHMFYLLLPSLERRQAFILHMREAGVMTPFHYVPLHTSTMGERLGGRAGDCPVTENVSERLVRLPLFASITLEEQSYVLERVMAFEA
jgi:dTDP-4-amino-4,6-dideoxygalactose transaminase